MTTQRQSKCCTLVNSSILPFTLTYLLLLLTGGLRAFRGRLLCRHISRCAFQRPPGNVATNSPLTFHLWTNDASLCVSTFSKAESWFCECPPLYTGRLCQFSACERNPCSHGATCIPKSPLEAVCLCPYGRQGLLCEERKCYRSAQVNINSFIKSLGCGHIMRAL